MLIYMSKYWRPYDSMCFVIVFTANRLLFSLVLNEKHFDQTDPQKIRIINNLTSELYIMHRDSNPYQTCYFSTIATPFQLHLSYI